MQTFKQRAEDIMHRIQALAGISEMEGGITRTYGTAAWRQGALTIMSWMQVAGLTVSMDNIGNVRGRLPCGLTGAKTFVIASHMDTVINAGKFDGPLGVVMGLDMLKALIRNRTVLPFDIELVAFCDEEGCRFHTTYLGSKVLVGTFEPALLKRADAAGVTIQDVIHANGCHSAGLLADAIPAQDWLGYFEIHIEQGPVLYEKDIPVAVVQAIAGQKRIAIAFRGMAGHAGTVPMDMRQDALCCAAEFVQAVESTALLHKDKIVATVGKLQVENAASNVIPGLVTCTLDLRSPDESMLAITYETLQQTVAAICNRRNILFEWMPVQETAPVLCDAGLNALLTAAIADAGYKPLALVSGAGHDAVAIAAVAPVSMLFVRCFKGISHHPLEDVALKDLIAAVEVADNFIQHVIHQYDQVWKYQH